MIELGEQISLVAEIKRQQELYIYLDNKEKEMLFNSVTCKMVDTDCMYIGKNFDFYAKLSFYDISKYDSYNEDYIKDVYIPSSKIPMFLDMLEVDYEDGYNISDLLYNQWDYEIGFTDDNSMVCISYNGKMMSFSCINTNDFYNEEDEDISKIVAELLSEED